MTLPIQKLDLSAIEQSQIARIAGTNLTLGGLVSAGVIVVVAFAAHWLVTRSLRRVRERADRSRQAVYLLERLAGYGIIVIGAMAALSAAGLNLSSLRSSPAPWASAWVWVCRGWSRSSYRACS